MKINNKTVEEKKIVAAYFIIITLSVRLSWVKGSQFMGLLPGLRVAYNLTYTVEKVSTHTWSDCPSAALYSTFWNFVSL